MSGSARFWDEQSEMFDQEPDHGLHDPTVRAAWRRLLMANLPPAPAAVADVGCGTGTLSVLLGQAGYRVSGIDFSPSMINRAIAKASEAGSDAEFSVADGMSPPWPVGSFDAVIARHVLWALPDPSLALRRWLSLLRPGGRLLLVEGLWSTGAGLSSAQVLALLGEPTGTTR
jgi:ubiquinone/menaquinone biosynthesis C-methylase UbiE